MSKFAFETNEENYVNGVLDNYNYQNSQEIDGIFITEYDCINHFPSFNHLDHDDMVVHIFESNQKENRNFEHFEQEEFQNNLTSSKAHDFSSVPLNLYKLSSDNDSLNWASLFDKKFGNSTDMKSDANCLQNISIKWESESRHTQINENKIKELSGITIDKSLKDKKQSLSFQHFVSNRDRNSISIKIKEGKQKAPISKKIKTKRSKWNKNKFTRWGKDKDKKGFKKLLELWSKKNLKIKSFLGEDKSQVINSNEGVFINLIYSDIFNQIAIKYSWGRKPIYLYLRFQKIYLMEQSLSVRDLKLLKKILIKSKSKWNIIELINQHFPFKNREVIDNAINEIMESKLLRSRIQRLK